MTKKLLAILITVVLVVSCMMVPAMAEGQTWTLNAEAATTIEMEWFFYGYTENPQTIPEMTPNINKQWVKDEENASNDYFYSIGWESEDMTHTFNVVSEKAQYYDVEFVASDKDDKSEISVYVGDTLVANTHTDAGTELYTYGGSTSMKLYSGERIPLNAGNNTVSVCTTKQYSTNIGRNAYEMDYIRFTPVEGEEIPFAVTSVNSETTQFSIYFNKPVLNTEENLALITVDASTSNANATITVDESSPNRVIVTCKGGRVTVNVDENFCAADGVEKIGSDYDESFFLCPVTPKSGASNKISKANCSQANRKVYAYTGVDQQIKATSYTFWVLALYDGDKLVAYSTKRGENTFGGATTTYYPEGAKFTEAVLYTWHEGPNGEYIPVCKPDVRTAADLGFTFE